MTRDDGDPPVPGPSIADTDRIDKWLWHARFFKTRSIATKICRAGRIRLNGNRVAKANATITVGDVLTFPQGDRIRVARVRAIGLRRGPAAEAQGLYDDLTPPEPPRPGRGEPKAREPGSGRPTKRERRAIDRLMDKD